MEGVVTTIADFLRSIGMAEYAAGLYESGIDVSAFPASPNRISRNWGSRPPIAKDC